MIAQSVPDGQFMVPDENVPGAWIVCKDGADQSWVDPRDPTHLEFEYTQRVAWLIDDWATSYGLEADARLRVVHIGGGGMTLARWLAVTRPTSAQIVLEPDTAITEAVRQVAPLPRHSGIKVRPIEGRPGIAAMPNNYADVVILDAFDNASVPASLVTKEFMADIRRVLQPIGLLVFNMIDAHPHAWAHRAVASVASAFASTCVIVESTALKQPRITNLVAGASPVTLPIHALTRRAAGAVFPCTLLADDDLRRWLGGARPFTDDDTQPSPRLGSSAWLGHY